MSNQDVTTHKFVAILNKKVEPGRIMNALAHMTAGLVGCATPEQVKEMGFVHYIDKNGNNHKSLSKNSFVVLSADNGNQIRTALNQAKEIGLLFVDFTHTMQTGTYLEQLETTKNTPESELEYYGIVIFGEIEKVNQVTKKFSLWR